MVDTKTLLSNAELRAAIDRVIDQIVKPAILDPSPALEKSREELRSVFRKFCEDAAKLTVKEITLKRERTEANKKKREMLTKQGKRIVEKTVRILRKFGCNESRAYELLYGLGSDVDTLCRGKKIDPKKRLVLMPLFMYPMPPDAKKH